jgi:hypothetical protein
LQSDWTTNRVPLNRFLPLVLAGVSGDIPILGTGGLTELSSAITESTESTMRSSGAVSPTLTDQVADDVSVGN